MIRVIQQVEVSSSLLCLIMYNPSQELQQLLDAQHSHLSADFTSQTATLVPLDGDLYSVRRSVVAFVACKILADLVVADDEVLWKVYGDIISKCPGSIPTESGSLVRERQREWVQKFRQESGGPDADRTLSEIRKKLATLEIRLVPPNPSLTLSGISTVIYLRTPTRKQWRSSNTTSPSTTATPYSFRRSYLAWKLSSRMVGCLRSAKIEIWMYSS